MGCTFVETAGPAVLAWRGADVAAAADVDARALVEGRERHGRGVPEGDGSRVLECRGEREEEEQEVTHGGVAVRGC